MTDDLISRQEAIDAIWDGINMDIYTREVKEILEELPTADLSEYCDKLWKTAYERGKAEAGKRGTWETEHCDTSNGRSYRFWRCSVCHVCAGPAMILSVYDLRYCPYCGARMENVNV